MFNVNDFRLVHTWNKIIYLSVDSSSLNEVKITLRNEAFLK